MIEQIGVLDYRVIVHDKIKTDEVNDFDKILITPGPGLPEDHPILETVIKQLAPSKSILGICLGHQAIAKSFGGELFKQENVSHGIAKKIIIKDSADYLFNNLSGEKNVGLYHSWAVSERNFPSELKITAVSEDGIIMAISHRIFDVRGVQFHPESIMTKLGKQILENWINTKIFQNRF
jgi:anthranilate synthase component 2